MPKAIAIPPGAIFGRLAVIEEARTPGGLRAMLCQCECGQQRIVNLGSLRAGRSKSCGCRMGVVPHNFEDRTGKRYGKLVAVRIVGRRAQNGTYPRSAEVEWLCACDCGNEKIATANALRSGHTQSCGCLKRRSRPGYHPPGRLPSGRAARNAILRTYRRAARERGLSWDLAEEEFDKLTGQDCAYCGCAPNNVARAQRGNGDFIYSGLDRKDNAAGYVTGNVLPCCFMCNRAKMAMPYDDFIAWITRIARFWATARPVKAAP